MGITITMSHKETRYEAVCIALTAGKISLQDAAHHAKVSLRHMRRIYQKYSKDGILSLCHKSRDKTGRAQYPPHMKSHILDIIHKEFAPYHFSPSHIVDMLLHEYGYKVSAPTIRSWMRAQGLYPALRTKSSRTPSHTYRIPHPCFGDMLQGDGSFHHWFGPEYPSCLPPCTY